MMQHLKRLNDSAPALSMGSGIRAGSLILAMMMAVLAGCGGSGDEASDASVTEGLSASRADEAMREEPAGEDTIEGSVSLTVNGTPKTFSYLPADKAMAISVSTMVEARPSADATESFTIMVMNFNLKKAELPVTLELGLRKAMEQRDTGFALTPKPLLEYVSPEGVEYATYGDITFESYDDGIARGSVENLEMAPSDKEDSAAGPVQITDIAFEVAL